MKKSKSTILSILSITLTLVFGILAVYFWWDGKKSHSISYSVSKDTSLIFNHKNSHGLALYEKDSIPVVQDVYMLQGVIWNDGDYTIEKENVRKTIGFKLADGNRILDYKIIKQTDANIAQFKLNKIDNNTLSLDWTYFDPKHGCSFQILYVGEDVNPQFKIMGSIVNIDEFKSVNSPTYQQFQWS